MEEIEEEWALALAAALALLAAVPCISLEPDALLIDPFALLSSLFFSCGCGDPTPSSPRGVTSGDLVWDRRALAALPRDDLPINDPDEDKGDLTLSRLPDELELLLSVPVAVGSSIGGGERILVVLGGREDGGERVLARELAVGFDGVPVNCGLSGVVVQVLSFAAVERGEVPVDGEGETVTCLALC